VTLATKHPLTNRALGPLVYLAQALSPALALRL